MHTYIQSGESKHLWGVYRSNRSTFPFLFCLGEHDLLLHTIDTHLDTDDVFTLDHTGRLVLSLNKDTYERFGITTQKRRQADAIRQKYGELLIDSVTLRCPFTFNNVDSGRN